MAGGAKMKRKDRFGWFFALAFLLAAVLVEWNLVETKAVNQHFEGAIWQK